MCGAPLPGRTMCENGFGSGPDRNLCFDWVSFQLYGISSNIPKIPLDGGRERERERP